tara:strand:- start:3571 stop:3966 length:396 start_codon:yes stop_codon:yes gene_type:complete
MNPDNIGVHVNHCCSDHGCKYGDMDCPVAYGDAVQKYPCESCAFDAEEDGLLSQRFWVAISNRPPPESGIYAAMSTHKDRTVEKRAQLMYYGYDADAGKNKCKWQHISGFFDNGLTHWLDLKAIPTPEKDK